MNTSVTSATLQGEPRRVSGSSLWLVGGRLAVNGHTAVRADVELRDGRVRKISSPAENRTAGSSAAPDQVVDLSGYLLLPGLINAHDHLEFNLFPRLGKGPYSNYEEWAADIYKPDQPPLHDHLSVPEDVRLWWGGLKNLLAGVTTVGHHNPYAPGVFEADFPVRVVRRFTWSHSLIFGRDIPGAFSSAGTDTPFIIHLGEGSDRKSEEEIFTLHRLEALDSRTVVVHGVGLSVAGHELLRRCGAALVWCPTSNVFTLGKTLNPQTVASCPRMALGNDSALTAQGDLLDEIGFACRSAGATAERAYSLVTESAADVLRLREGEGVLRPGARADLMAIQDTLESPAEALVKARSGQVELVILEGAPKLFSPAMSARWPDDSLTKFELLRVGGVLRLVRAPVHGLIAEARRYLGHQICLAGKEIWS